jgi:hypothetical protein
MRITSSSKQNLAIADLSILSIASIVTLSMLVWLLWRCNFGLDFTDESFYLIWISNPFIYQVSASQFGFVYHPLYKLVGGDIVFLRQSNIVITFGLAWILCIFMLRSAYSYKNSDAYLSWKDPRLLVISAVLASTSLASLVFSGHWFSTPSYNTLAFNALLLAGIGAILSEKVITRTSMGGWLIIGIAGWMAFMAKPTTALALGSCMVCYLILAGKLNIRGIVMSIVIAVILLACSAWIIDGSITVFVKRLSDAVELAKVMQGGHAWSDVFRWDSFKFSGLERIVLSFATLFMFVASLLASYTRPPQKHLTMGIVVSLAGIVLGIIAGLFFPPLSRAPFQGLQVWAAPMGGLLAAAVVFRRKLLSAISKKDLALALCFMVFPHVYAFGTNDNYWGSASVVGFFWVMSGVALLCAYLAMERAWRIILQVAIGAQVIMVASLYVGMEHPYRQMRPLRLNTNVVEIGSNNSRLVLNQDVATYLVELRRTATGGGFKSDMPMIDLTGHFPGALFALDAKAIGQAWIVGGYPGSETRATLVFDRVSCQELLAAWVLTEPSGIRKLSDQILWRYGLDLQRDYIEVGRLHAPKGEYSVSYEQVMYRPAKLSQEANASCEQKRASL